MGLKIRVMCERLLAVNDDDEKYFLRDRKPSSRKSRL